MNTQYEEGITSWKRYAWIFTAERNIVYVCNGGRQDEMERQPS